jgi:hypothetical protein
MKKRLGKRITLQKAKKTRREEYGAAKDRYPNKTDKLRSVAKKQIAEGRAKMRDKAKVKKYNTGGELEVKQLDPLGKRLSDVGMMGGVGKMNKFVLRNQKKAIQKIPNKNFKSPTTSGKEQKKLAIKEQKNIESKMTRKGQEYKPVITRSKRMGGGMMQRPMGYKKGTMVKARGCKLGRSKPTKMY